LQKPKPYFLFSKRKSKKGVIKGFWPGKALLLKPGKVYGCGDSTGSVTGNYL